MLWKKKNLLSFETLKLLYKSLFHSYLEFSSTFLMLTSNKNIDSIESLQKKAIRFLRKEINYPEHLKILYYQKLSKTQILETEMIFIFLETNPLKLDFSTQPPHNFPKMLYENKRHFSISFQISIYFRNSNRI